ncbi:MAG: hypothetical protein GY719_18460 [bacterium]|nr:hypothetical protein [bacterium]
MSSAMERRLMLLLHGELPADEARRLERQLERDGELRALYERLAVTWRCLAPPAVTGPPAGFASQVALAARAIRDGDLSWSLAPAWARGGAGLALAAGLALGMTLSGTFGNDGAVTSEPAIEEVGLYADSEPLSLAEVYWMSLEEGDLLSDDGTVEESVQ